MGAPPCEALILEMGPPVDLSRLVETFFELVHIDSPSRSEADVAAYCKEALEACGCYVEIDDTAKQTGSNTGNLIATLPGTGPGRIYLSAHMDTVEPGCGIEPYLDEGVIRSEGETVLGADDKAGIAAIIETIRLLSTHADELIYPEVKVILSVQEEKSLVGARAFDPQNFNGEPCYVLDAAGSPGTVVIAAPHQHTYRAYFTGHAAHAGICPEEGKSAIFAAAAGIATMPNGRIDEFTTANVGMISGGVATNIVPEHCMVAGECRSSQRDLVFNVRAKIDESLRLAAKDHDVDLRLEWSINYEGYSYEEDDPLIVKTLEIAAQMGLEATTTVSGGGSDANIYVQKGLRAVCLGCGMTDVHSSKESITLHDLKALNAYIIALVLHIIC